MPIAHLACLVKSFPGLDISEVEPVVERPGWLLARTCKFWYGENPTDLDIAELLYVYRSPLVTDLKKMYAPVLDRVLNAEQLDVVYAAEFEDEEMMYGTGELTIYRMAKPGHRIPYTVAEARATMDALLSTKENPHLDHY